ncbi:ABC transporter substrate-binding protein [Hoeflea prorocentri]|uniref:ABC transporter substrate-binding protein n=1 Tax=Hoeflea prorocentri TaxID=1922333 RepID=A0A9X3UHA8_9HYPH|nr:ABC transporter substrate-binding protein [Hoeflea prorocentri]MCY6381332.1 ABC transporter substrate-binding protein [Hoeflea prorocentri]MDA5399132.1 ABC transporter substrate-binding protein [Hoeflea prorocentri]
MSVKSKLTALASGVLLTAVGGISSALALDEITVAYFLEWPTANQVAQLEETYDKELGVKVNWRAFGNGNEMTQAMVSGDIQIAYSQGFVPFVVGVSTGAPLKMVGVAVTYAENDLCVVRDDAGITKDNAKELEGKKVATPIGNVTHYKLLRTLDHLGVDVNKVNLVQMNPPDGAVALTRGDVVMACGFGGALSRMREVGSPLMTGAEQEAIGINTFDIISVTESFAKEHPELVEKFMAVTEAANAAYKADPDAALPTIAKAAGMDEDATKSTLANFGFPSAADQKSENWLGGGVQQMTKGVADVMVEAGGMDAALDSYDQFIDPNYLN